MAMPLNDCGCCEGITAIVPEPLNNRPGLSQIRYRVGRHGDFLASALAALSEPQFAALRSLTTRETDDFTIALLDGWATLADVFTFYQERVANESYLRTASERLSVRELARLIGYELRPGVAASVDFAFLLEEAVAEGVPRLTNIPIGTAVQSIPGPEEVPQTFETTEEIEARPGWNALAPRTTELIIPKAGDTGTYLEGVATNLKPGDGLLFVGLEREQDPASDHWDFRRVASVELDRAASRTHVTWHDGLGVPFSAPAALSKIYAFRQRAALFGANAPDWRTMPESVKQQFLPASSPRGLFAEYFDDVSLTNRNFTRVDQQVNFDWSSNAPAGGFPAENYSVRWSGLVKPPVSGAITFFTNSDDGVRLWVNGQKIIDDWNNHSATENQGTIQLQAGRLYSLTLEYFQGPGHASIQLSWSSGSSLSKQLIASDRFYLIDLPEWPNFNLAYAAAVRRTTDTIYLDAVYPRIVADSWIALTTPTYVEIYQVAAATDDARSEFTLSSKTTRLKLNGENLAANFGSHLRDTVVFGESELLDYAEQPLTRGSGPIKLGAGTLLPVEGNRLTLAQAALDLSEGRRLIVSGKPMRVEIVGKIRSSAIRPDESGLSLTILKGDRLQLLARPAVLSNGNVQLHLADAHGVTGFVVAAPGNFLLQSATESDEMLSETTFLQTIDAAGTQLTFGAPLRRYYDRATVVIYANVAAATHGETKVEVLGSGDASQPDQTFNLKQPPLTYVAATNPNGAASTLSVRVNDLLWHEVPSFYGRGPRQRIFVTRQSDGGKTTVEFGDGKMGARLPSGNENVNAHYRKGLGPAGNLPARQLSLLMSRPLGVKSALNPAPASGGADGEVLAEARANAPFTVLTLDRVVSLADYENFSRAYAGIGKALATWTWDGRTRGVFITVAGQLGAAVSSSLSDDLITAIHEAGDPFVPVRVASYDEAHFKLAGKIKVDPDYESEKVLTAVREALRTEFSFVNRIFGQPVALSEVIALIQGVAGVVAVDLDTLHRTDQWPGRHDRLEAALPHGGDPASLAAAELLTLDQVPIELVVMP